MATADTSAGAKVTIHSVQAMRGLAAVSVAAFHTSLIMADPKYGAVHALESLTMHGWMGVNFFFVLSGFIIFYAHGKDVGHPGRLGAYAWRRFSRIYPVYWVLLTAFIAAALAGFGSISFRVTWGDLVSAYTLIPWVSHPTLPLKVAWTLVFEIFFYGVFALLVLNRLLGIAAFTGWAIVILTASFLFESKEMGWMSMWNSHFYAGALALLLYRKLHPKYGAPLLCGGIALLVAMLAGNPGYADIEAQQSLPLALLLLGVPFLMILSGGALAERHHRFRLPRIALLVGDASYALYLTHSAVISACCMILHRFAPGLLPPLIAFALIFSASIIGGIVAHILIERPIVSLTRKIGTRREAPSPVGGLQPE